MTAVPDAPANRRSAWQDPRVPIEATADGVRIHGSRCSSCGSVSVLRHSHCLGCGSLMSSETLAPEGTLWGSTVIRIPVGERMPPYTLAYVDLVDGPRLLCHVVDADGSAGAFAGLRIGERMTVTGTNEAGDPIAVPLPSEDDQ